MTALVKNPQGRTYAVKNLGWLLHHFRIAEVNRIEVLPRLSDEPNGDQVLKVYFEDDYLYTCIFADPTVLKDWLSNRKVLKGAVLFWHDELLLGDWQWKFTAEVLSKMEW